MPLGVDAHTHMQQFQETRHALATGRHVPGLKTDTIFPTILSFETLKPYR